MTDLALPLRVSIASGERLIPTGTDLYTLPWVQGAASTLPRQTRMKYPGGAAALQEKLSLLRSRRPIKDDFEPLYGPRRHPQLLRMDQQPGNEEAWS